MSSDPSKIKRIEEALREAIKGLDEIGAPSGVAAYIEEAIHRLRLWKSIAKTWPNAIDDE